ncbi:MAG TPA: RNase A-like domain-containing protein [Stellaceae bacterium]|nr:RNase A-like domain-containing protein [Stellaceae bacterium]
MHLFRVLRQAVLLASIARAASAQCIPADFPADYLERAEAAGGHTLARHVGKSDDWLMARLASDAHLHVASSYIDRETAEAAIETLLSRHRDRLNRWVERTPEGAEFTVRGAADRTIGRTAWRPVGADHLADSRTLVVVVKKAGAASCLVLTSYPGS